MAWVYLKIYIRLLISIANPSNRTNLSAMHDSTYSYYTLINLHDNKQSQELRYSFFAVNLDRCVGSCWCSWWPI